MWISIFFLLLFTSTFHCSSLNFVIYPRKTECFYFHKEKGDLLEAWFEVAEAKSEIEFILFGKDRDIITREQRITSSTVYKEVNVTGDYAFCFGGRNVYNSPVTVYFDFDQELGARTKDDIELNLSAEKRRFLNKVLNNIKFEDKYQKQAYNLTEQFMMDVVRGHKDDVVRKRPDASVENSLLYISILADRMQDYMEKHKIEMRRHTQLQESNRYNVMVFSFLISVTVVLAACVQLVVLKSFFTGIISFQVWKF